MSNLGSLVVEVSANIAKWQSDAGKMAAIAEQNALKMEKAFGLVTTSLKTLGAGFAVGLTFDKIKEKIEATIASAAGLQQLSERTGATVEGLSALASVAKLSNTDTEALATGLQKLAKSMNDANNGGAKSVAAFQSIGLSVSDLKNLRPDEAFLKISNRLAEYGDGAGKVALAQALLGKSGANLLPVMKDLADVGEFQVKVTEEQARAADEYEKNMKRLDAASNSLFKRIGLELVPVLDEFSKALLESVTKNNGLKKSVDDLAADGSIRNWAENAALGIAIVIESVTALIKGVRALGGSFEVVGQDVLALANYAKLGFAATYGNHQDMVTANEELQKVLLNREKVLKEANERYATLATASGTELSDSLKKRFAALNSATDPSNYSNEGRNYIKGRKQISFDPSAGTDKQSPGEKFIEQLQRQIQQQEKGRFEMLRLEAAQKGVAAAANPYIVKLEQIEATQKKIKRTVEEVAKEEEQRAKVTGFVSGGNDLSKSIIQQAEAIGLNATQQRRLTELRKLDDIEQRAMQDATSETRQEVLKLSETMRANLIRSLDDLEKKEKSFGTGVQKALADYAEAASDQSKFAENLVTGGLKRMEDALINFAKTGKLSFADLFSFMAEEYLRQQIRMAAANFMGGSSLFSSFLGLFGGSGGGAGTITGGSGLKAPGLATGLAYVPHDGYAAILHEGERVMTKQENQSGGNGAMRIDFGGQTINVGQGVSRGEVHAAVAQANAESEKRIRRLMQQGALQ